MSACVLCVVHPGCQPFLQQFIEGLTAQTRQDFEVLVLNDGLAEVERYFERSLKVHFREAETGRTPCAHRRTLIKWALESNKERYIFADADDYFPPNRISKCLEFLDQHPIVVNELICVSEETDGEFPILGSRFANGARISSFDLRDKNCLGLTNTAVRKDCLDASRDMPPDDVIAFDWLLFSHLLGSCGDAIFTSETHTYYRQYPGNTASLTDMSDERIIAGVDVKLTHYRALSGTDPWYCDKTERMAKLAQRLRDDVQFRKIYCDYVRKHMPKYPLWWEAIKSEGGKELEWP